MNGSYWFGQDGNVWVLGPNGTNSAGKIDANSEAYWNNAGFTKIPDPAVNGVIVNTGDKMFAPTTPTPIAPTTTTTTATTPAKVFNSAGATNTQRTIDQIPALLQAALDAEGTKYGNTINDFNTQEQGQRKTYEGSTTTNQQNYDANFMDSIRAGIHGLGGLMALLRGTGASGGTAEDLARDTVGGVTAQDIRGGADTQKENQTALDSSLSTFLSDLQRKRQEAQDTRINNERAVRRDSNTQLQDLFGKMAGFYGDVGNTAAANDWMNRAGALTPDIAANSRTQVSPYDTTPVTVQAPQLTAFAGPTKPSVTVAQDGQVGSGIFSMIDPRRRKDATVTPVPVGV